MFQAASRAVLNLQEFVVREVRTNLEWASMSSRVLGLIVGAVSDQLITSPRQPG